MVNILCMCTVWGEPLSQTAQSFMPEMIYGANRNLMKVPINSAHFPLNIIILLVRLCPCWYLAGISIHIQESVQSCVWWTCMLAHLYFSHFSFVWLNVSTDMQNIFSLVQQSNFTRSFLFSFLWNILHEDAEISQQVITNFMRGQTPLVKTELNVTKTYAIDKTFWKPRNEKRSLSKISNNIISIGSITELLTKILS